MVLILRILTAFDLFFLGSGRLTLIFNCSQKIHYGLTASCCSMFRGPTYGYRGKVLLPFEENRYSKIGVRFDKIIPDGVDLGGLCEGNHGFFCNGNVLIYFTRLFLALKLVKFSYFSALNLV